MIFSSPPPTPSFLTDGFIMAIIHILGLLTGYIQEDTLIETSWTLRIYTETSNAVAPSPRVGRLQLLLATPSGSVKSRNDPFPKVDFSESYQSRIQDSSF